MLDEENVAGMLAIEFRDPAAFAFGIEVGKEVGNNAVPRELLSALSKPYSCA